MGDSWSKWANEEEKCVKELLKKCERRFNILVVGLPGAGKSSLVSSLRSCLTHNHGSELGISGHFHGGESFTFRLLRHAIPEDGIFDKYVGVKLPVVYDMPGLPNVDDERICEIMRAVLNGTVPIDEAILVTAGMTASDIAQQYAGRADQERDRIDRVIFVHGCDVIVPENLIKAVVAACNESNVVLFSVLSKADTKGTLCSEEELERALGTSGTPRGCKVQLYHKIKGYYGRYYDIPKTNYFLLLMWKALLNTTYPIHSTHTTD